MPRRVLFFTTSLGGGGAESHALRVMNELDRSRYVPVLAVSRTGGGYEAFLRADVEVHSVSPQRVPSSLGRLLLSPMALAPLMRRLRPALVCSLMDPPNLAAIAAVRLVHDRPKLVVCVQIPPSIEYRRTLTGRATFLPAIRWFYPLADRVIALSHGVKVDLAELQPSLSARTTVIHNACVDARLLDDDPVAARAVPTATRPVLLAAGRLTAQKGYPYLLDALGIVRKHADVELWILGEGPDRGAIEAQIARLGLRDAVRLLGFQKAPQAFMRRASVFVLSSIYEGFGNVIVEALACGAPVVSTDCPHGPGEIIEHGKSGLLVPIRDPAALAREVLRVLGDDGLRERLRVAGRERSAAFHGRIIANAYADEFDRVLAEA